MIHTVKNWRKILLKSKLRYLAHPNTPVVLVDKFGFKFIYYSWMYRSLESHITRQNFVKEYAAMRKLIRPGSTVFDIGANVGVFSVPFSSWVGAQGRVYSFEPVEDTYWLLQENISLNKCSNIISYQQAISDKQGVSKMHIFDKRYSSWNSMGFTSHHGSIKPKLEIEITSNSLDSFCRSENISVIDYLKVDVEGYEYLVFKGVENLLSQGKVKYLSFEVADILQKVSGHSVQELFKLLSKHGYSSYQFDAVREKFTGPYKEFSGYWDNFYASQDDLVKII